MKRGREKDIIFSGTENEEEFMKKMEELKGVYAEANRMEPPPKKSLMSTIKQKVDDVLSTGGAPKPPTNDMLIAGAKINIEDLIGEYVSMDVTKRSVNIVFNAENKKTVDVLDYSIEFPTFIPSVELFSLVDIDGVVNIELNDGDKHGSILLSIYISNDVSVKVYYLDSQLEYLRNKKIQTFDMIPNKFTMMFSDTVTRNIDFLDPQKETFEVTKEFSTDSELLKCSYVYIKSPVNIQSVKSLVSSPLFYSAEFGSQRNQKNILMKFSIYMMNSRDQIDV